MPIFALLIFTLLFLSACGTLQPTNTEPQTPETKSTVTIPTDNAKPSLPPNTRPFPAETFYDLLVAEMAANRRQYSIAINNYAKQAQITQDIEVTARAARIAQFFRHYPQAINMATLWLEKAPNNLEALSLLSTAYIELNEPEKALNNAERILAIIDPAQPQALQQAAITETIANRSQGQTPEALKALITRYRALNEQYPNYPAISVGLSRLHEWLGENTAAYTVIEQTLSTHSDYMPAIIQQVRLLQLTQQPEAAIARLKEQLVLQPSNTRLRLYYARLLMQTDPEEAYKELTQLSKSSPDEQDITFLRALVAYQIGEIDIAHPLFIQLLNDNYQTNSVNFYLGNLEAERGNTIIALGHYLNVKASEEFVPAQTLAGSIIAKEEGIAAAHQHFEGKRASSPRFRTQLYIAEANLLDQQDNKTDAINLLSEALEEFPDNISLRYNRSIYYEQQNQLELMEIDLRYILNIDPDNASTLNALGYALTNKTNRYQEALTLIQRALELRPNDAAITDSMGWALYRIGRYEEAISHLRKAFKLFPDPEVAAHLGEVLWVAGEQKEAKEIWRSTLQKNPSDHFIPETMRRFDLEP